MCSAFKKDNVAQLKYFSFRTSIILRVNAEARTPRTSNDLNRFFPLQPLHNYACCMLVEWELCFDSWIVFTTEGSKANAFAQVSNHLPLVLLKL